MNYFTYQRAARAVGCDPIRHEAAQLPGMDPRRTYQEGSAPLAVARYYTWLISTLPVRSPPKRP